MKKKQEQLQTSRGSKSTKPSQMATRSQMERLFRIVEEIQGGGYPNCPRLQKLFEIQVDRRTILRDIEFLKDRMNAPLEYDRTQRGYYFTDDFTLMPPLELKGVDFLTLQFLRQSLAAYEDTEIGGEMRKSFEKMFGLLTGTKAWKRWDAAVAFRGEPKAVAPEEQLETLEILFSAIHANRVVTFEYHGRRKEPTERQVEPSLVVMNKGRWYLYAVDRDIRDLRTFALDRIKGIKETRREFGPPNPPLTPQSLFWRRG
jgi:predicted DNA-binding transcriptional regulator YafY